MMVPLHERPRTGIYTWRKLTKQRSDGSIFVRQRPIASGAFLSEAMREIVALHPAFVPRCAGRRIHQKGARVSSANHAFHETLPVPFEWDLKRLATSAMGSGRVAQYSERPPASSHIRSPSRTASTWPNWLLCHRWLPRIGASISPRRLPILISPRCATRWRNALPACWKAGRLEVRREKFRAGRGGRGRGPYPRDVAAGLSLEHTCLSGAQDLRVVCGDTPGRSPGAPAYHYTSRLLDSMRNAGQGQP